MSDTNIGTPTPLAGASDWLAELQAKQERGELPICDPNEATETEVRSDRPHHWPEGFIRLSLELKLARYLTDLAKIARGELPQNGLFKRALATWTTRESPANGLLIFGSKGVGKSVTALGLCLVEFRVGRGFDFLDAGEFADLWAQQDRTRIGQLKETGVLVIDEIGDCEDIKGPAFGLMKRVINARYRNLQPVILLDTENEADMQKHVGEEILDRFPKALRIDTDDRSFRP